MKKERGKIKKSLKASALVTLIIIGVIISMIYLFAVSDVVMNEPIVEQKQEPARVPTLITGDADPGDNSGFFYFMIYPHQADPATAYASNLSNASAYEYSDSGNASCTGETPFSTTFDVVWKVGVTNEDGQWTSNSTWNPNYFWFLTTCSGLSVGADTNVTLEYEIANTTDYAYYHYVMNNGGAGYTIIEGQGYNWSNCKFYVQRIV